MSTRFITFEGGEGAGKSTQLRLLAERLELRGVRAIATREPGGPPAAEFLRGVLLDGTQDFAPLTEMMLHFAARAEHVTRTIQPALAAGAWVLSDRFFDSTEAYQVYGQGGDPASYAALKTLISPHPDLTLMLVVSPEVAAAREAARGRAADRYDRMGEDFRRRVTEGFLAIAAANPARCVVVNGDGGAEDVAARIFDVVAARFL